MVYIRLNRAQIIQAIFFAKLRSLLFSKRKALRQNALRMCINSSAANLCIAKHNNFIFSSSGYKTRVEKCKVTVDKINGTSRRLSIVSCGDPLGSPPLRESK